MKQNVLSVVLVAVIKDNKILLLKRKKEPLKGYWGLIGGKLHTDESIEECARRETKEETGLDCKFISTRGVIHERLYDKETSKYGYVFFFTEVYPKNNVLVESDEGELKWVDIDKIENERIVLSDIWMIKNLLDKTAKVYSVIMNEKNNELHDIKVN